MCAMTVGKICIKNRGRDGGRKCIIVAIIDDNRVLVTGPKVLSGVRRRKVSMSHLVPLDKGLKIRHNSTDETVLSSLRRAKLEDFMRSRD